MSFNEQLPEWNAPGTEPTQEKKDTGWQSEEKPPADYFNWFFNRVYKCLQEIRNLFNTHEQVADTTAHPEADRTLDPTQAPAGNVGPLSAILNWFANRIKTITGKNYWYEAPTKNLEQLNNDVMSHFNEHVKFILSAIPPENPNVNTYWYEDLGDSDPFGGFSGLLIGNASDNPDEDVWFDDNI